MVQIFQYSFEKSCFSHKLFVTLSSVAVSRQKGRSRVNESFMRIIWMLRNQERPMIAFVLQSARKKDFASAKVKEGAAGGQMLRLSKALPRLL